MAAPTNVETTVNMVGQRESLSDVIHYLAPDKTPFVNAIGKGSAKARYEEWQTETLRTPDATRAALEGDTYGNPEAPNRTTRVGNYCHIFYAKGGVSRTADLVDKAGRKTEKKRQRLRKGQEAKTDMEARMVGNYASQNESGANPRHTAGALAWAETVTSRGATGSDGGFSAQVVSAATNGTQRPLTEAQVRTIMASGFDEGAYYSKAIMSSGHKQQFAQFAGIADIRMDASNRKQAAIMAGADVYKSDFGDIMMIPHQYGLSRDILFFDPSMLEVRYLDGFKTHRMAKNADADQFLITAEATLCVKNEKAIGVIADIT